MFESDWKRFVGSGQFKLTGHLYLVTFISYLRHKFIKMAEQTIDESKTVRLVSQEGESFDVPVGVARMSELVKSMIDGQFATVVYLHVLLYTYFDGFTAEGGQDDEEAQEIPLPNVKAQTLARVIEFCQHYKTERMTDIEKVCHFVCYNL